MKESHSGKRTVAPEWILAGSSRRTAPAQTLNRVFIALVLGLFIVAIIMLVLFLIPWTARTGLLDSHVATYIRHGKAVTYLTTPENNPIVRRLPLACSLLVLTAVALLLSKHELARSFIELPTEWPGIRESLRDHFPQSFETQLEMGALLTIFAIGVFLRLWHLGRPVRYDEAYSYLEFASHPLYKALSFYQRPNNHLLNTLLVHCTNAMFGPRIFALRLPAFVAGCLTIPMSWLAGRFLYGPLAGILTAGCVAAFPTFIEFSVNARGYAFQWVFILTMMWLAVVLYKNPSFRTGWLAFVVAGVAGFYSIPTMIIPVAGIVLWMLVSMLAHAGIAPVGGLLKRVATAGLAMGLVSACLYIPPLVVSGPAALMSNPFVSPRKSPFFDGLPLLAHSTWMRWTEGVPAAAIWLLAGGIILALLFHREVSVYPVSMTIVLWVWSFFFAWARNILGYPRVWSYLLLAAVMTASAGLSVVARWLARHSGVEQVAIAAVLSAGLAFFVGFGVIKQRILLRNNETGALLDADEIVSLILTELRPGDSLVATLPAEPIVNYELRRRNPKLLASLSNPHGAVRVVAVVPKPKVNSELYGTDKLLALLAAEDTSDPALAQSQINLADYAPPRILAKFLTTTVYSFERRQKKQQPRMTVSGLTVCLRL